MKIATKTFSKIPTKKGTRERPLIVFKKVKANEEYQLLVKVDGKYYSVRSTGKHFMGGKVKLKCNSKACRWEGFFKEEGKKDRQIWSRGVHSCSPFSKDEDELLKEVKEEQAVMKIEREIANVARKMEFEAIKDRLELNQICKIT